MSRGLRIVWLLLGLASLMAVFALFFLPTEWEVRREIVVDAPPEAIYPHLVDLARWGEWSPWQEEDYPDLEYRYSDPPVGVGAEQTWDSEATGDGAIRIVEAEAPRRVAFEMRFQSGTITARDEIRLEPTGDGATRIVWTDRGSVGRTLLGRLSVPVIEESMGRDLEAGLQGLGDLVSSEGNAEAGPTGRASDPATAPPPDVDPGGDGAQSSSSPSSSSSS